MQKERVLRILILILSFGSLSTTATFILKTMPPFVFILAIFILLTSLIEEITKRYGKIVGLLAAVSYLLFLLFSEYVTYASSVVLSFSLLIFPFFWSMEVKRASLGKTLNSFGIKRDRLWRNVALGLLVTLFILYPLIFIEKVTIIHFGFDNAGDMTKVVKSFPLYFAILSFIFAPFAEEIFFRGFLLDRIGILLSSLLFALAHYSYNSTAEFAVAFTAGFVFAIIKKRRDSLIPTIAAHALFNFITVVIVYILGVGI